jgi:hypothetical protein
MILQLNQNANIEDLRNHPAEVLEQLRTLLAGGAQARVDPRRRHFYEVEDGSRIFYIHICPSGKVLLLASWDKVSSAATCPENVRASALAFC